MEEVEVVEDIRSETERRSEEEAGDRGRVPKAEAVVTVLDIQKAKERYDNLMVGVKKRWVLVVSFFVEITSAINTTGKILC